MRCINCQVEIGTPPSTCGQCGTQNSAPATSSSKRLKSLAGAVLFGAAVIGGATLLIRVTEPSPEEVAQKAAKAKAHQIENLRIDAAIEAAKAIKRNLREPESVVFEVLGVSTDAQRVCVQYRARNGFGGMARDASIFLGATGTKATPDAWKKHCGGLGDYLAFAK